MRRIWHRWFGHPSRSVWHRGLEGAYWCRGCGVDFEQRYGDPCGLGHGLGERK